MTKVIDNTRKEYTPIWIESGVNARIEDDGSAFIIIGEDDKPIAFIWKGAMENTESLTVVNKQ